MTLEHDNGFSEKEIADCFNEFEQVEHDLSEAHTLLAKTGLPADQYNPISSKLASSTLKLNKFHRVMSFLSDGVDVGQEMYNELQDKIKTLEGIINLKEKERKEWADMCIKKQAQTEDLKKYVDYAAAKISFGSMPYTYENWIEVGKPNYE